jgi:hypothetical protein
MDTPDRKPIEADARETLVAAARRFMALHPDVQAVGLTVASKTIDPLALSTIVVGADGPIQTPDLWLLCARRFVDAALFCGDNAKALILGLDELASNLARRVAELKDGTPAATSRAPEDREECHGDGR